MNINKRKISVITLALALGGLSLSSCSKGAVEVLDGSSASEQVQPSLKSYRVSLSAMATSEAFGAEEPVTDTEESRAINYNFTKANSGNGNLIRPRFNGVTSGSKFLCIIRSDNPAQPVSYIQATWTRVPNTNRYYILQSDGDYTAQFQMNQPLGNLYMMVVVGGEWNARTQKLKFSPQLTPVSGSGTSYTGSLDVPYISEWLPLDVEENNGSDWLKLKLRGYKTTATADEPDDTEPHFTLKPQGMLMRVRLENEMPTRTVVLNSLTVISTAYAAEGEYDLSKASLLANLTKAAKSKNEHLLTWSFADNSSVKASILKPSVGITLAPASGNSSVYNTDRNLRHYWDSPYALTWMMPTGQVVSDIGAGGTSSNVRTDIYANLDDARANATKSNIVYTNTPGVDAEEANGKLVVPSMKVLPVYASRELVRKNGTKTTFKNGSTYLLVLNIARHPMLLDLLSEREVATGGASFANDARSNVHYFRYEDVWPISQQATTIPLIGEKTNTSWEMPSYEQISSIAGFYYDEGAPLSTNYMGRGISTVAYPNVSNNAWGNYSVEKTFFRRMLMGFPYTDVGGRFIAYNLMFAPNTNANSTAASIDRSGVRMAIVRYEYSHRDNATGIEYMKMTARYLGSYSMDAANYVTGTGAGEVDVTNQAALIARMQEDTRYIVSQGDTYWVDPFRSQDDVVRYFPLLGRYDRRINAIDKVGDYNYVPYIYDQGRNAENLVFAGMARLGRDHLLHHIDGASPPGTAVNFRFNDRRNAFSGTTYNLPIRLVRKNLR